MSTWLFPMRRRLRPITSIRLVMTVGPSTAVLVPVHEPVVTVPVGDPIGYRCGGSHVNPLVFSTLIDPKSQRWKFRNDPSSRSAPSLHICCSCQWASL